MLATISAAWPRRAQAVVFADAASAPCTCRRR
jgi:hypothetical protein